MSSEGEIAYWVELILQADQGSDQQNALLKKLPQHLFKQIYDEISKHYSTQKDEKFNQLEKEIEYKDNLEYGIDAKKKQDLEEGAIKLNEDLGQVQPYAKGKDMEEHHAAYEGIDSDDLTLLNSLKRDTGSSNQTDILPHLFKQQTFYEGIVGNFDKTIAVAKEGFSQVYFLTRIRKRASGSLFRKQAKTSFASELQAVDKTVASGEVVEKRIDNANPFQGKFTFKTTYGAPPTSSLSQSQIRYTAQKDLGQEVFGADYILYNTSTGSLSSGSYLQFSRPTKHNDLFILDGGISPTTSSVIDRLQFRESTLIKYYAKWEQNITTQSLSSARIQVDYTYRTYKPSVTNGTLNSLFPTKKTVLVNGNILIT